MKVYANPMKVKYRQQHDLIFKGVEAVKMFTDICMEALDTSPRPGVTRILTDDDEEAYRKADITRYLEDFINKYILW